MPKSVVDSKLNFMIPETGQGSFPKRLNQLPPLRPID